MENVFFICGLLTRVTKRSGGVNTEKFYVRRGSWLVGLQDSETKCIYTVGKILSFEFLVSGSIVSK